jgi:Asp-tRNA(Asn)/Glu-tRNA(Gln) amidotransferase A subunit family amidase
VNRDRLRRLVMIEAARWFEQVDVILGGPLVGPMALITNFTGHPCLALRSGFRQLGSRVPRGLGVPPAESGAILHRVPHSVWLWGRLFDEGTLLQAGRALEQSFGVAWERPEGFV